jgi:hypothetical protein
VEIVEMRVSGGAEGDWISFRVEKAAQAVVEETLQGGGGGGESRGVKWKHGKGKTSNVQRPTSNAQNGKEQPTVVALATFVRTFL